MAVEASVEDARVKFVTILAIPVLLVKLPCKFGSQLGEVVNLSRGRFHQRWLCFIVGQSESQLITKLSLCCFSTVLGFRPQMVLFEFSLKTVVHDNFDNFKF